MRRNLLGLNTMAGKQALWRISPVRLFSRQNHWDVMVTGACVLQMVTMFSEIIDSLRVHGKGHHKYDNVRIGINGRLDTIQAAILLAKMSIFPEEIELRQTVVQRYSDLLAGQSSIIAPKISEGMTCAWAQYTLLAQDEAHRAKVQDRLKSIGVPTAIYYPKPLHLQPAFEFLEYDPGSFPTSENFSKRVFSIPMHPYLTMDDQRKIVDGLL